jgi:hypothetical protein
MNPNQASSTSESAKGRAERLNKPSLRARARNQIVKARLWLGRLVSFPSAFPFARVLMIFVIGFGAGVAWQSYGGEVRKTIASWSPHLSWLAPPATSASSERIRAISLALATARQNLDKVANEINRLPAQDADTPRRRANR